MSRHHRASAGDAQHLHDDVEKLPAEEARRLYGIEKVNGRILDTTQGKMFDTLWQWAQYSIEQDEIEYDTDINHYKEDSRPV